MKTRFYGQEQKERITELRTADGGEPGCEPGELEDQIRALRDSLHNTAERQEVFWVRQRAAIRGSLRPSTPVSRLNPCLLWAPVFVIVLTCLFLFTGKSKLPAPDFAVGADQNLLVDVERALSRDFPEALAPAATLVQEIR